jgi:hypothetical protein
MFLAFLRFGTAYKIPYNYSRINYQSININGYKYDLSPIDTALSNTLIQFTDINDDMIWDYIHQFNGALNADTVRGIKSYCNLDLTDVSTIRCNDTYQVCYIVHYVTDFDFKPYSKDFTSGIIYYAEGQPIPHKPTDNLFVTVDFYFAIAFESGTSIDISQFNDDRRRTPVPEGTNTEYWFNVTVGSASIISTVSVPTPTPYFSPNCLFQARALDQSLAKLGYGYDFHLDSLTSGPFGIRSNFYDTQTNKNATVFYNPCGRASCPWDFTCGGETYATVWYCIDKTCQSTGILGDHELSLDLVQEDPTPMALQKFNYSVASRTTENSIQCSKLYPVGHLFFNTSKWGYQNGKLYAQSYSEEICLDKFPQPEPPVPGGKCNIKVQKGDYLISSNIATYNQPICWDTGRIKVTGPSTYLLNMLYYQPCGAVECLDNSFCEGDEDATVWYCHSPNPTAYELAQMRAQGIDPNDVTPIPVDSKKYLPSGKKKTSQDYTFHCRAYGLYSEDIDLTLADDNDPSQGFVATYYNFPYSATIYWNCNPLLADGVLGLPDTMKISDDGRSLTFNVTAEDACAVGPPTFYPPKITPGPTPSPTPQPSPNPIDFAHNGTHYIYTNLDQIQQDVFNGEMKLAYPGLRKITDISRWKVVFHPWDLQPCPEGYDCYGFNQSNIWGCYEDQSEDNKKYCYSIGDRDRGNDMKPFNDNLDNGAKIFYEGVYGIGAELDVTCNPKLSNKNIIEFDSETIASWQYHGLGVNAGAVVVFSLDSAYVCPTKFADAAYLPSTPTATPKPSKYRGATYFTSEVKNGTVSQLDISRLDSQEQDLYIGKPSALRPYHIAFHPLKKKSCPAGYECLGGAKSNFWICDTFAGGEHACIPTGDIDAGFDVFLPNDTLLMEGINLEYSGGYNGYVTNVLFQCNDTLGVDEVLFEPVVENWGATKIYTARAHTGMVCPGKLLRDAKSSGGSIFLFILIFVLSCYFTFPMLFGFYTNAKVEITNAEFWYDYGDTIKGLLTCNSNPTVGSQKNGYDNI